MLRRKKIASFEGLLICLKLCIEDVKDGFGVEELKQLDRCIDRIYVILDRLKKKHPYVYERLIRSGMYV